MDDIIKNLDFMENKYKEIISTLKDCDKNAGLIFNELYGENKYLMKTWIEYYSQISLLEFERKIFKKLKEYICEFLFSEYNIEVELMENEFPNDILFKMDKKDILYINLYNKKIKLVTNNKEKEGIINKRTEIENIINEMTEELYDLDLYKKNPIALAGDDPFKTLDVLIRKKTYLKDIDKRCLEIRNNIMVYNKKLVDLDIQYENVEKDFLEIEYMQEILMNRLKKYQYSIEEL